MNTNIDIRSRAHRALRGLKRYSAAKNAEALGLSDGVRVVLGSGEHLIGSYDNSGGPFDRILVTDRGLIIVEARSHRRVDYSSICEVVTPDSKENRHLELKLFDGTIEQLIVRGGEGRLRDVFAFQTFLRHAARCSSSE